MRRFRPPITVTVPMLVAGLMVVVGLVVSERVMSRLVESQERNLAQLSEAYLDGLSASIQPHMMRGDIWEVFDALDRSRDLYQGLQPIETVAVDGNGLVIAASDPRLMPSRAPLPEDFRARLPDGAFAIDPDAGRAYLRRPLDYHGTPVGALHAVVDIGYLLQERRDVVTTLIVTNAALTIALAAIGYLAVRRMVQPTRVLTEHLTSGATGRAEPIPEAKMPAPGSEAHRLYAAYNALVLAERERESLSRSLAEEERLASLGRLTAGMAHEINNPLGGLFNALATLKRHGSSRSVRETTLDLLERGLVGIRDVVAAALESYRPKHAERPFGPNDLEDIRVLVGPEVRRRRLALDWSNGLRESIALSSAPLRQAVLNLLLNACAATPEGGRLAVSAVGDGRAISIEIADGGSGLSAEAAKVLTTAKAGLAPSAEGGLGLWMVRSALDELGGEVALARSCFGGTLVRLSFAVALEAERVDAVA